MLLVVAVAIWPALASAARLQAEAPGPPAGTTIDGFNQVMGPSATEPEHAGEFVQPRPEPCPSCSRTPPQSAAAAPAASPPVASCQPLHCQ
jgi:hypothetical protein